VDLEEPYSSMDSLQKLFQAVVSRAGDFACSYSRVISYTTPLKCREIHLSRRDPLCFRMVNYVLEYEWCSWGTKRWKVVQKMSAENFHFCVHSRTP